MRKSTFSRLQTFIKKKKILDHKYSHFIKKKHISKEEQFDIISLIFVIPLIVNTFDHVLIR